jgi:hypothetical protein
MQSPKGPAALAIMIGRAKPAPSAGSPSEPDKDDSYGEDLTMASSDLLDAIKAGDARGVGEAFKAMHTICATKE